MLSLAFGDTPARRFEAEAEAEEAHEAAEPLAELLAAVVAAATAAVVQTGQIQSPSGKSALEIGGTRHSRWKVRRQPSQHSSSPSARQ